MSATHRVRSWLSTPTGVWVVRVCDVVAIGSLALSRAWIVAAGYAAVLTVTSNPLPVRCADCGQWATSTARITTSMESEHGTTEFVRTCCGACASQTFGVALDAGFRPPPPDDDIV